ncbi:hypothetical protein TorRG33x02_210550 [Trema orientale]|uniref:Uncharacterized protein n=1 Tax=Trema orientale TaxID=63057 RepID=A0A2P5EC05_TREOI|nr:hypothetical protein TorRG33x02_210550 [Trema orientale]
MPQVDLETLVSACAGGGGSMDRKIACETLADAEKPPGYGNADEEPEVPPDFPPESFWLSKDAEFDWFDRNAFYERKESQKGNSNSTNLNPNLNPGGGSNSNSNSQRFSMNLKSKAAIIGLPKPQKTNFVDAKHRKNCRLGNTRLFPKRSGSSGKSDGPMIEPSSPKVSCMGRVRSKRDRKRRWRKSRQRSQRSSTEPVSVTVEKVTPAERRKTGFFASFRAIFRTGCREKSGGTSVSGRVALRTESPPRDSVSARSRDFSGVDIDAPSRRSVEIEPPGLGGLHRFASGRRSGSWVGEAGVDVA